MLRLSKKAINPYLTQAVRLIRTANVLCDTKSTSSGHFEKTNVNAVIIGGGSVGVSTAYHLSKYGLEDVVLLEKSELTAGSTWHAAGLVTTFLTSVNAKKINMHSVKLYSQLEAETGQDVGFHKCGSLRLLETPTRMDEAKYQMTRHHWNEAEQYLIGPEKVLELCPLVNPDKILGGVYNVGDGHIDPYSLTQALAIGARQYGAVIRQRTPALGIQLRSDGKWDVETEHGVLTTKHLINASGFYANEICEMAGFKHYVPTVPVHHEYFITKDVPELTAIPHEIPVLRDLEGSYYCRQEKQGLLFGFYEHMDRMDIEKDWVVDKVPNFEKELYPDNLERIMPNIEMAMQMVPALSRVEISAIVNGPITYNCQNSPLIGPIQGVPNFWQMSGFGYGIAQAGGAGHFVASWIKHGEPPHELTDLDSNRYGKWATKDFALAKARESYGLNNFPTFPKEERAAGRPSPRCGPLYEFQKSLGAEMGFVFGFEKPNYYAKCPQEKNPQLSFQRSNWFSAVERECKAILSNVGILDLTAFAKYKVKGEKATEFLDIITANNLPKPGTTCITHMLTDRGRVFAELTLTNIGASESKGDEGYLVVTGTGSQFHDLWWMEHHRQRLGWESQVEFDDVTDKVGVLSIAGPNSRQMLESITDCDLSPEKFKFLQYKPTKVCGIDVSIIRISYTGELGWEIYCPIENLLQLYQSLHKHGKQFNMACVGAYALNSLRIEKGFRMWSADMTMDTNPIEAGLGFFVKQNKASEFVGKSAIQEILSKPLPRKLMFLHIEPTDNVDAEGDESVFEIKDGDCPEERKVIGNITSGAFGFQVNKSIAMAYLPTSTPVGSTVAVELLGKHYLATVHDDAPCKIQPVLEREQKKLKRK